ncbi:hypothetical protein EF919_39395 [Streptomyces sp. WAC02707]|uniref:hypothetical protein n=1 Tax=Streptomyces sp. WAC02707 TaxID=2487417 RepID=UPI000F76B800|nr:hypothetical protein [Streptomyces sp. WAC02707]RSS82959.1 hypothetical protein EF919_39395 [Streptomyces sp. WAC02707]
MSIETLTRFRCDAPNCAATGIGHDTITPPDGWTRLKSTAHIPTPDPNTRSAAMRRTNTVAYSDQCRGSFTLHLCPDHPHAFDAHRPITTGYGGNHVRVSCACGANLGIAGDHHLVNRHPAHAPENVWFHHLPAELRWYLWRGQRQWGTRDRIHGREHVTQHLTEERARSTAVSSSGRWPTELVYRDTEADPWTPAPDEPTVDCPQEN